MMFQAVRNEQRGLVVGSLILTPKIPSSNPSLKLQKKPSNQNHQTGGTVPNPTRMKALVAQRQSVYNIVGHPT